MPWWFEISCAGWASRSPVDQAVGYPAAMNTFRRVRTISSPVVLESHVPSGCRPSIEGCCDSIVDPGFPGMVPRDTPDRLYFFNSLPGIGI